MKQVTIKTRVRPSRVAVLVPNDASQEELLLGLRFLSRIWGGRYSPLLTVERSKPDPLTLFRLGQSRPDFVYGINIDNDAWRKGIAEEAQPRGFGPLTAEFTDNLREPHDEDLITVGHVIVDIRNSPQPRRPEQRTLRIINCEPTHPLAPMIATLFGVPFHNFEQAIPNTPSVLTEANGYFDLMDIYLRMVQDGDQSWLDVGSHRLTPHVRGLAEPPPTIVLVQSQPKDLARLWNLRLSDSHDAPTWLLPVPADWPRNAELYSRIRDWLLAFDRYQAISSFCQVTSASLTPAEMSGFADDLKKALAGTHFETVRVTEPLNRLPIVVPFESEPLVIAESRGRRIRLRTPVPALLEGRLNQTWVVDLVEDDATRRAVGEVCLPSRLSSLHVLNAAGPTHIQHYRLFPMADGPDGINYRANKRQEYMDIYLPTPEEVLEEALRECGVEPKADEKRSCYRPAMRIMGGLEPCARFFAGRTRSILRELEKGPKTVAELKGLCGLGKGELPELTRRHNLEASLGHYPEASRRVAMKRFQRAFDNRLPKADIESLLEFWIEKGIASRRWRLGPCSACMQTFWVPRAEISRPIPCPGCGHRVKVRGEMTFGYELHPLISRAVREGLGCVALTARFLKSLTSKGFLWLPGCKCHSDGVDGDLDIVAVCDGILVFVECKTRSESDPAAIDWTARTAEFEKTIALAEKCRASLIVYSSLLDRYPEEFTKAVEARVMPPLKFLLLTKDQLDRGYGRRTMEKEGTNIPLRIDDCVIDPMPEKPQSPAAGRAEIKTPFYTSTFG